MYHMDQNPISENVCKDMPHLKPVVTRWSLVNMKYYLI